MRLGRDPGLEIGFGRWYLYFGYKYRWLSPFNWLTPDVRYWGYQEYYWDGPIHSFGFWFFNVSYQRG